MPDASTPTAPQNGTPAAPASPPAEQPPAWFADFAAKVEGKFTQVGQDFGRIREKLKIAEPKDEPKSPPAGDPRAETLAAMKLGELRAKLPEKARGRLDERINSGMSFSDAVAWAEDISAFATQSSDGPGGAKPPAVPTGQAGTAASSSTPTVSNRRELLELAKKDPAAYERLIDSGLNARTLKP